jgi:hypothetical protein
MKMSAHAGPSFFVPARPPQSKAGETTQRLRRKNGRFPPKIKTSKGGVGGYKLKRIPEYGQGDRNFSDENFSLASVFPKIGLYLRDPPDETARHNEHLKCTGRFSRELAYGTGKMRIRYHRLRKGILIITQLPVYKANLDQIPHNCSRRFDGEEKGIFQERTVSHYQRQRVQYRQD